MAIKEKLDALKQRLREVSDLRGASYVLVWDQLTYMPPGGAPGRARQQALVERIAHEHATDPEIGRLLDDLHGYGRTLAHNDPDAALLRVARRDYERAIKVPAEFVAESTEHFALTYELWTRARPANDFGMVRDALAKTLDYSRRMANFFPGYKHIMDPLIDFADDGMTYDKVKGVFAALRAELVPLVAAIAAKPQIDNSMLFRHYPKADQERFGIDIIKAYGYDFERGRQDLTTHPFMIRLSGGDVRITTRFAENDLRDGLFGTLHEAGHALYEMGIDPDFDATPLGTGVSAGVHESQSRLWENQVGRSRPFWGHYYGQLQSVFPQSLGDVPLDSFYRAINRVEPSLIRVDADEVTYNLHVMIRFDLEAALLDGSLAIDDLPEAWNARYTSDLGITPPDDKDGVLQDVHWFGGPIGGAFQGYTLGNLIAAQLMETAQKAQPQIADEIGAGEFGALLSWLRMNVHKHGSQYVPDELIEHVTGSPLRVEPLMNYLRTKFGAIYGL